MITGLTELLFEQKLKETRTICLIHEVIAIVRMKHDKREQCPTEDPSGSARYHQSESISLSPNFTFYFHSHFHFLPKIPGSPKAEEKLLLCITPCQRKPSTHPRALLLECNIPDKKNCCSDLVHHQLGRRQDVIQGLRGIEPGMVQHPLNGQAFLRFDLQQPGEEKINP